MERTARLFFLPLLCAGSALAAPPRKKPLSWWNEGWKARVLVSVGRYYGPSAALTLPTAGMARPDGADIRLFTLKGKPVPHKVLHNGPGDRVLLYFDASPFRGAEKHCLLYFGNPKAGPPAKTWKGMHGPILETRRLVASSVATRAEVLAALKRSRTILGRDFTDRVFQGLNPFTNDRKCLTVIYGFIVARRPGTYTFATNSYDASLFMVDGRTVTSWLGWHRPTWGSSKVHSASIGLKKGTHAFFYVNATRSRGVLCSLGVKLPGAPRLVLAPPSFFVRWTRAFPSRYATLDKRLLAWFSWRWTSDLGLSGKPVTAVRFKDLSGVPLSRRRGDFWDFGDGTTSRSRDPAHVFLEAGVFPVTHVVYTSDGKKYSLTQRVFVHPKGTPGWRIYQDVKNFARILRSYNPARLSPGALASAVFVFRAARDYDGALPFLYTLIRKSGDMDKGGLADEAFFLAGELLAKRRDYKGALEILEGIRKGTRSPRVSLKAAVLMADILYENMGEIPRARALLEEVVRKEKGRRDDTLRFALIKKADLLLEAGDRKGARALLEKAAAMKRRGAFLGEEEASAGEHMTAYEEYAGRKDYASAMKELRAWEWDAPLDKLTGLLRYLKADLYVRLGRPAEALREIERMEKADPESPDLPAALIMAAQCRLALGKKAEARKCLERIIRDFPVSDARPEAEKRLKALQKSPPGKTR